METAVILAAQAALIAAELVAMERNIFITPHESFIPSGIGGKAIGLRNMGSAYSEGARVTNQAFVLQLICWVPLTTDGAAAVVGDDGVSSLAAAALGVLADNRLGMRTTIHAAYRVSSSPTTLFVSDNQQWLVKQTVSIRYELQY